MGRTIRQLRLVSGLLLVLLVFSPEMAVAQETETTGVVTTEQNNGESDGVARKEKADRELVEALLKEAQDEAAWGRLREKLTLQHRPTVWAWLGGGMMVFLAGIWGYASRLSNRMSDQTSGGLLLPLGLPDGSIRAILSIFVVVFGFAIIMLKDALGLYSAEAIAGFVGAVIAFYFATRNEAVLRETAVKAADAATTAAGAAESAAGTASDMKRNFQDFQQTVKQQLPDPGPAVPAGTMPEQDRLREIVGKLEDSQSVLGAAATLARGTGPAASDQALLEQVEDILNIARGFLDGNPSATEVARVAEKAGELLRKVNRNGPVTSAISELLATVGAAISSGSVQSGLLAAVGGTPLGLAASVISALLGRKEEFDRWKMALTERPFDLGLLADTGIDGLAAEQILLDSPLMASVSDSSLAIPLLQLLSGRVTEGGRSPEEEFAEKLRADDVLQTLAGKFTDEAALFDAIREYRATVANFLAASKMEQEGLEELSVSLPEGGTIAVSPEDLARATRDLRQSPEATAALERLIYLLEAIVANVPGKLNLLDLLRDRLGNALNSPAIVTGATVMNGAGE